MLQFETMVSVIERIVGQLSKNDSKGSSDYESNYVAGAYFVAVHCREPVLRRRALHVLNIVPQQEGMWASKAAAAIAQRWIEIEEEDLDAITTAAEIPEHRRITCVDVAIHAPERFAQVRYRFSSRAEQGDAAGGEEDRLPTERWEEVRWRG